MLGSALRGAFGRRALIGGMAGAIALASGAALAQEQAQDKGTIYYMLPTLIDEFQTASKAAFEAVFPTIGYQIVSMDAQNRADLQLNQMDDVIALHPKAIIMNAVDFDAVVPGIEKARAAGIPVVIFDRQIKSTPSDLSSVAGTVEIGQIAAGEIARLLKERHGEVQGTVLQILGDPGDSYTLDIQKGFEDTMAQYPDVEILSNAALQWDPANVPDIVSNQLLVHPDIDLIFVHAAHLAVPVVSVLEANGKQPGDIMLVSSNGAPVGLDLIRQGWEQVEVEQPTFAQIYGLAMFMDKIIAGEPLEPGNYDVLGLPSVLTMEEWGPNLKIPGSAITAANVDDPKFWGNQEIPTAPVEVVQ